MCYIANRDSYLSNHEFSQETFGDYFFANPCSHEPEPLDGLRIVSVDVCVCACVRVCVLCRFDDVFFLGVMIPFLQPCENINLERGVQYSYGD